MRYTKYEKYITRKEHYLELLRQYRHKVKVWAQIGLRNDCSYAAISLTKDYKVNVSRWHQNQEIVGRV